MEGALNGRKIFFVAENASAQPFDTPLHDSKTTQNVNFYWHDRV